MVGRREEDAMKRIGLVAFIHTVFVALLAASCGSNGKPAAATGGSAGPDAAAGAVSGDGGSTHPICPGACTTARTCHPDLDVTACEAQCTKELAGTGYLAQDVAQDMFKALAATSSDTGCLITSFNNHRKGGPAEVATFKFEVADPAAMKPCTDARLACFSDPYPGSDSGSKNYCFLSYYRYSETYRAAVRQCFASPCKTMDDCFCEHQLAGDPWVASPPPPPPQPPESWLTRVCPPPK
jgi:hypothetical protein